MIELLHIHIPKTAGKTLLEHLKNNYGESAVKRYERGDVRHVLENFGDFQKAVQKSPVKAINGHIKYFEIRSLYLTQQPKIITFLRDPVDRVISNYKFFIQRISANPKSKHQEKRQKETLLEYAGKKQLQNVIFQYLDGLPLTDFYFLGMFDTFETDLQLLAKKLKWKELLPIHINQNNAFPLNQLIISEADRQKIRNWNHKDQALYEKALILKDQINSAS